MQLKKPTIKSLQIKIVKNENRYPKLSSRLRATGTWGGILTGFEH